MTDKIPTAPPYAAPDGVIGRPLEVERKLNDAVAIAFSGQAGEKVLDYLTSITLHYVCGPEATDGQIRHLEGQRYLVSVIKNRIKHAEQKLPQLPKRTIDD